MVKIEQVKVGLKKNDAVSINVRPMNIELFAESCGSYWQLFDIDGLQVDEGNLLIPSNVYLNWAEDDNVIVDYVIQELGLIRVFEVDSIGQQSI